METIRVLIVALIFLLSGCQSCTGIGSFSVTRDTEEVIVEGTNNPLNDLVGVDVIPAMNLDFDLQNELAKQDAKGASGVFLTGLVMTTTDTARATEDDIDQFDFLNRIEFYVESTSPSSTLEKKLVASLDPVPEGQTELVLETDESVNLKPYAEEGILLTTEGAGTVPDDDVSIVGTVTIEIKTL